MTEKLPAKRCKGTSKRTGKPCQSPTIMADGYCWSHTTLVDEDKRFGSPEQTRAAAATPGRVQSYPKLREQVEQRIEAEAEAIVAAPLRALRAQRGLVVGEGPDQHVELIDDNLTQTRAAETLMNRALGRPANETTIHADTQAIVLNVDAHNPENRDLLSTLLRNRPMATQP